MILVDEVEDMNLSGNGNNMAIYLGSGKSPCYQLQIQNDVAYSTITRSMALLEPDS